MVFNYSGDCSLCRHVCAGFWVGLLGKITHVINGMLQIIFWWWTSLVVISLVNGIVWLWIRGTAKRKNEVMIWLSGAYVFGCAFRAVLPRIDVARVVLFNTWFSNVLLGRSVATIAELCFIIQWFLVLHFLTASTKLRFARALSLCIIPLIIIAEIYSWYATITTNYLGNVIEESLWMVVFIIIFIILLMIGYRLSGIYRRAVNVMAGCVALYVAFMAYFDVPSYVTRWTSDRVSFKPLLGFFAGIHNLASYWRVAYDIGQWKYEMIWMSLYFSVAVWASLLLCYIFINRRALMKHFTK